MGFYLVFYGIVVALACGAAVVMTWVASKVQERLTPTTELASTNRRRFVWWVVGTSIALVLITSHQWIFGLPGRIGEFQFERSLRNGMSRNEVAALIRSTGGDGWIGSGGVRYIDQSTLCVSTGREYLLNYDQNGRLTSWSVVPWDVAC
jgi:hypothetical protein